MKLSRLIIVVIILVGMVVFSLIVSSEWFRKGYEHQFYSGFLGSILATIFAAFLVWVAWEELSKLRKTSSADFIHRLDNDFFTPKTSNLVSLIDYEALEFCPNEQGQPYFKVDFNKLNKTNLPEELKGYLSKRMYYSTWEVDDSLLGLLENVGILERKGIVDFQMVYEVFSWYLKKAWDNDHIKKYIIYSRRCEETMHIDTFIYYHFQYIAIKCLEYDDLHSWYSRLWWKLKRHFWKPKIEMFPTITTW